MNESWHIPRASLSGSSASSSSNSSNKSYSNPSTVARHSRHLHQEGHLNLGYIDHERIGRHGKINRSTNNSNQNCEVFSTSTGKLHRNLHNESTTQAITNDDGKNTGFKRGSRSSQGSTNSNSSTHSASSGSLLLTAANLERFVEIHKKQQKLGEIAENRQNYNSNITISQQKQQHQQDHNVIDSTKLNESNDTVIEIDPNLHFVKTKDVDTVSIASSTHFTMVNGVGGPPRKIKEGLCSRGHQVTVLIVSMSFFFLIGISAMVYLLEMRAREMPMN